MEVDSIIEYKQAKVLWDIQMPTTHPDTIRSKECRLLLNIAIQNENIKEEEVEKVNILRRQIKLKRLQEVKITGLFVKQPGLILQTSWSLQNIKVHTGEIL